MLCTIPRFNRRRFRRYFDTARGLADDVRTVAFGDPARVAERWFQSEGGWHGVRNRWRTAYETGTLSRIEATDPYAEWLFRPQQSGGSDKFGGTFSSRRNRIVPMAYLPNPNTGSGGYRNASSYYRTARGPTNMSNYHRRAALFAHSRSGLARTGGYTGFPSILNGELKYHDVHVTNPAQMVSNDGAVLATASGGTYSLNLIPQDASSSGRIGRKAVIKSIEAKLGFYSGQVSTANPNHMMDNYVVHFFLVLDTQCNGAIFNDSDVWEFGPDPLPRTTTPGPLISTPLSMLLFRNLENVQRFKVLRHIVVPFRAGGPFTKSDTPAGQVELLSGYSATKTLYMKCNIPIDFDAGAVSPSITNVRTNNLQWIAFANCSDLNASIDQLEQYYVHVNTRLRFTDTGSGKTRTRMGRKRVKRSGS